MLKKQKVTQRNITPNFIIMKSTSRPKVGKNAHKLTINKQKSEDPHPIRTDRSSSRNSKCSFEAYERRVLHLSKLKNSLATKHRNDDPQDLLKGIQGNKTFDSRRTNSNTKDSHGRQNHVTANRKNNYYENSLSRKKSSGSGKIIFRGTSRSNSKRDEDSLEKEEQRAKMMNANLIESLAKNNQTPNYIHQLKLKKNEKQRKRQTNRYNKILNLDIQIKGPQAIQAYQIYGELGKGAYGVVRMGINKKTNEKVAIKFYPKKHLGQLNRLKNLEREINILSKLDHPIIAKLIETIETAQEIYLVLEYGGANSLYNYLLSKPEHRMKQFQARKFLHIIVESISYLHYNNIVHRDIKAENILLNRYKQLKLIDFGFTIQSIPPDKIDTFCGTPTYMAPQIVSKIDHVPIYTDMWSIGILYYVMLQGNYPFRSKDENELFQKIRKGRFDYIHHDISKQSRDLIASLLQVDPLKRITVDQMLSEKYSKFFAEGRLDQQ